MDGGSSSEGGGVSHAQQFPAGELKVSRAQRTAKKHHTGVVVMGVLPPEEQQPADVEEEETRVSGGASSSGVGLSLFSQDILIPNINFSMVSPGVYRSGYPSKKNFPFLKRIGLKSIVYLAPEEYAHANQEFCKANGITIYQFGVEGNKEPFVDIPEEVIRAALVVILDRRNHPLLIHCNKGKHRTGVTVGCIRKVQRWSLTSIFDEYRRFAGTKVRMLDQQFVELFNIGLIPYEPKYAPKWLY